MHTIYKYKMLGARQSIDLPIGAKVLTMQAQPDGELYMWVWLDKEQKLKRTRNFLVVPTGDDAPLPDHVDYIATAQVLGIEYLPFVWHLFEVKRD